MRQISTSISLIVATALVCALGILLPSFTSVDPIKPGKLHVKGTVKNEFEVPMDSVVVVFTDSTGTKTLDTLLTNSKGQFKYQLPFNNVYRAYFIKEGFAKVYALYNAYVPENILYKDDKWFDGNITMLRSTAEFNKKAISRQPYFTVAYDNAYDNFLENVDNIDKFLAAVTRPNVGEMVISGVFQDSLSNSFKVKVIAVDTLGLPVEETMSDENGNYTIAVPLQMKVFLRFESQDHYQAFATVNTEVPLAEEQDEFEVKQDFTLVNRSNLEVNKEAFDQPMAKIERGKSPGTFVASTTVEENFKDVLLIDQRKIKLTGVLTAANAQKIKKATITVKDKNGEKTIETKNIESDVFEVYLPFNTFVHVYAKAEGFHETFISYNTDVPEDKRDKQTKISSLMTMYSREDGAINPMAFELPAAKYYFDEVEKGFKKDPQFTDDFIAKLNSAPEASDTTLASGLATLTGSVIDPSIGKRVENVRLRVLDENRKFLTAFDTDKKGRFTLKLNLNRVYYLEVEKEEYLPTQVKFMTQVPDEIKDQTLEVQHGLELVILHQEAQPNGDGNVTPPELIQNKEISAYMYNKDEKEFVEDLAVFQAFLNSVKDYYDKDPDEQLATNEQPNEDSTRTVSTTDETQEETPKGDDAAASATAGAAIAATLPLNPEEDNVEKGPKLFVTGRVLDEYGKPKYGAFVSLVDGKKVVSEYRTDSTGRYNMAIPPQKEMKFLVEGNQLYTTKATVNTTYPEETAPKDGTIRLPDVTAYSVNNDSINPKAFDQDWQRIAYSSSSNSFERDPNITQSFAQVLGERPDPFLLVQGRAKDQRGRNISHAQILVKDNGTVVDTVYSDKKGRYNLRMKYQKNYRLEVIKSGYRSTFAAVSTRTSRSENAIKKIKSVNLMLVNSNEENINEDVFKKPYTRVAFDASSGEFVEVQSVTSDFLANMYDGEGSEKEYQLESEPILAQFDITEDKGYKENVTRASTAAEMAKKRAQNEGQSEKASSLFMGDFNNTISGLKIENKKEIKDVSLTLTELFNARLALSKKTKMTVDENIAEASVQKEIMSDIISSALGMRRDADLVSTDSTLNVGLLARLKHIDEGKGVYTVSRDQIYYKENIVEYVETVDWFLFSTFYRNNQEISEAVYTAELDSIRSNSYIIN